MPLPMKAAPRTLTAPDAVRNAYEVTITAEAQARLAEIPAIDAYAEEQLALAKGVSINDEESNAAGAELVVNLAKTRKAFEDLQKYFTSPLEARKKQVIAVFKGLSDAVTKEEVRLRDEAGRYFMVKENARRAEEAARIQAQQEAERKARAVGKAAPKPLAAAPVAPTPRTSVTENGSLAIKLVWGFDVIDPAAVPRKYLAVDERSIRAAIADGVREIPGVVISERPQSAVK